MAEPGEDIVQALEEPVPAVGVTDEERGLASDAHVKFESKQFDESLSALDKLAEMRPKDGKVHHNRCVTQFYQSNCTKTDEFKKNLQAVRKQVKYYILLNILWYSIAGYFYGSCSMLVCHFGEPKYKQHVKLK